MSTTNYTDGYGISATDDELLRVIEQHLPSLWKVQRHVGNHGLLSVLKTAERKLSQRRRLSKEQSQRSWGSEDSTSAFSS